MIPSTATHPTPYHGKRFVLPCVTLILVSFGLMLFYGNIISHSYPGAAVASQTMFATSYTVSTTTGNCNCTVFFAHSNQDLQQLSPSLSCQCLDRVEDSSNVTVVCPDPPPAEIRFVEKEVIKECPVCVNGAETVLTKDGDRQPPWFAEGRNWHYPATLPLCTMDTCFDYSRCDNTEELLIYTYDTPKFHPLRYFQHINESKYHTDDPTKACLFLVPSDPSDKSSYPEYQKVEELPYWNGGMNHVILTFHDNLRRVSPTDGRLGNASIVATDMLETRFRSGFDISLALPGKIHAREFQSLDPLQRKYLLTFRGTRYLDSSTDGSFRSRKEFREMHNGKDVIVVAHCDHPTNNKIRKLKPELGEGCDEDKELWSRYNYKDLMNSTFALVPAGRQPASYRFIESIASGAIPVLVADNYVKPFDTLIPWYTCVIQFPTTEMHRIVPTLRKMPPEERLKRQRNCLRIYEKYLKDDETLFESTIKALKARFLGALPNLTEVRRR